MSLSVRIATWITPEMSEALREMAKENGSRSQTVADILFKRVQEMTDQYQYADLFSMHYPQSNPKTAPGWGNFARWTRIQLSVQPRTPSVLFRLAHEDGHDSTSSWIRAQLSAAIEERLGITLNETWGLLTHHKWKHDVV